MQSGWIGHTGDWCGYQTLTVYLPSKHATVVLLINTDFPQGSLLRVAAAITRIITPKHVYDITPSISDDPAP